MKRLFLFALVAFMPYSAPLWACLQAGADSGLPRTQGLRLCHDSKSGGPVRCFQEARDASGLNAENAIQLCQCAHNNWPVECVKEYINNLHKGITEALLACEDPTMKNIDERRCLDANEPTG
jgi:hypothetical protein